MTSSYSSLQRPSRKCKIKQIFQLNRQGRGSRTGAGAWALYFFVSRSSLNWVDIEVDWNTETSGTNPRTQTWQATEQFRKTYANLSYILYRQGSRKMALKRLEWHLEQTNALHHTMMGFLKQVTTQWCSLRLQQEVFGPSSQTQTRTIVGIDIHKVFDSATHQALMDKLKDTKPGHKMNN